MSDVGLVWGQQQPAILREKVLHRDASDVRAESVVLFDAMAWAKSVTIQEHATEACGRKHSYPLPLNETSNTRTTDRKRTLRSESSVVHLGIIGRMSARAEL